jgi:hypothetical protein
MKRIIYALAAATVASAAATGLLVVAAVSIAQNVSFTFMSRARNSGCVGYHLVAALASNFLFAALFLLMISVTAAAKENVAAFVVVYTLATTLGSVVAHVVALRYEKGAARTVQEDRIERVEARLGLSARGSRGSKEVR